MIYCAILRKNNDIRKLKKSSFFKQLVFRRFTISSTQTCAAA